MKSILTGKTQYRIENRFCKTPVLVLQVERKFFIFGKGWETGFSDATIEDLQEKVIYERNR